MKCIFDTSPNCIVMVEKDCETCFAKADREEAINRYRDICKGYKMRSDVDQKIRGEIKRYLKCTFSEFWEAHMNG